MLMLAVNYFAGMAIISAILILIMLGFQALGDRKQRRLADEYLQLIKERGFVSEKQVMRCLSAIQQGDYQSAIHVLKHPEMG